MGITAERTVVWYSCGAASAVAAKLTLASGPAEIVYCETGAEHPDNERFLADCERWLGRRVTRLRSDKYADTWGLWAARRYLSGVEGALCTTELKVIPRLSYQRPTDVHVFGYTADKADANRAARMRANYPEMTIATPPIDRGIAKAGCLSIIKSAGIELPPLYALGFHNNNCIPCVKATSPDYWALVRKEFPRGHQRFSRFSVMDRFCGVWSPIDPQWVFRPSVHQLRPTP